MIKLIRLLLILFVIIVTLVFTVSRILSENNTVQSKNYVIEAWGMPLVIEKFEKNIYTDEANVFVIGKQYSSHSKNDNRFSFEYNENEQQLKLYELAYLTPNKQLLDNHRRTKNIQLLCSGRPAFGIKPLIFFKVNDTIFLQWISDTMQWLEFRTDGFIRHFTMGYVNDVGYKTGDRMVFLRQLCFDTACYMINDTTFRVLAGVDRKNVFHDEFKSDAEIASLYLRVMGVPPEKIKEISFEFHTRNLTLQSARACKTYLQSIQPEIKSFNIVTLEMHSRRSNYVYRNVFGNEYNIGVIPIETGDLNAGTKRWEGFKMKIEESIVLIVSWILPWWYYR